jgi:hypothetical protein
MNYPIQVKAPFDPWYNNGKIRLVSIQALENELNSDPTNQARGIVYNFLSNLPSTVRTAIKNQTFPTLPLNTKPVDAFLLAESDASNSFISDTTISPNSVPIDILSNHSIFDIDPSKVGISQIALNNFSAIQNRTSEIGISQISSPDASPRKNSPSQISPAQIGSIQTSLIHDGASQVGISQIDSSQLGLRQILSAKINSIQTGVDYLISLNLVASKISDSTSVESQDLFILNPWLISHGLSPNFSVDPTSTLVIPIPQDIATDAIK